MDLLSTVLVAVSAAVIVWLASSPFEALGWWAGWFGEQVAAAPASARKQVPPARHYIVFLSGIGALKGAVDGGAVPPNEISFLDELERRLPDAVIVRDVFPYAVTRVGLTGRRPLAAFWNWLEQLRVRRPASPLAQLIVLRNLGQVLVSADARYGPIFNLGMAQAIADALTAQGYRPGSGAPVTLLGSSGGGQIAVGAVKFLSNALGAPVRIISLAGVMAGDPGVASAQRLVHFYGSKDWVHRLGDLLFPRRWPFLGQSAWNQARARGMIQLQNLGPIVHTGPGDYFDPQTRLPDGRTCRDATIAALLAVLAREGLDTS